jgi:hypothetical protein
MAKLKKFLVSMKKLWGEASGNAPVSLHKRIRRANEARRTRLAQLQID